MLSEKILEKKTITWRQAYMMRHILWVFILPMVVSCVDPFNGSTINFTFDGVPPPCQLLAKYKDLLEEGVERCSNEVRKDKLTHYYELWGSYRRSGLVRLAYFSVQSNVDIDEHLALEKQRVLLSTGEPFKISGDKYFDEYDVKQQEAIKKQLQLYSQPVVVSSYSKVLYSDPKLKKLHPDYFVGGIVQPQFTSNGTVYGLVRGADAVAQSTNNGGTFVSPYSPEGLDSLMVGIVSLPVSPERSPVVPRGVVFVTGDVTSKTRRTLFSLLTGELVPDVKVEFSIWTNLGESEYF